MNSTQASLATEQPGSVDWTERFAARARIGGGDITAILSLVGAPGTITFSGGFPAPETFPVGVVEGLVAGLVDRDAAVALQYTPTEGLASSRMAVAELVEATQGARPDLADVLVTSGGIEALQLLCGVFVDPGDTAAVEAPTYLGALMAFRRSGADVVSISMDDDGLHVDELERHLLKAAAVPKLLYVIPDHQNPTGLTMSLERRRALVDVCARFGVLVVEDVAYRELGFDGHALPSLWSLAPHTVLQIGTFSKILFPGVRLGWAVGPRAVVAAMSAAKQNTDQCAGALGQRIMSDFVNGGHFEAHLAAARRVYASRAGAMLEALERSMPPAATWTRPRGGFFVWLTAPEAIDTVALSARAQREGVAFVPGAPFYVDDRGRNQIRLAFSGVPEDRIEEGIKRLGRLMADDPRAAA